MKKAVLKNFLNIHRKTPVSKALFNKLGMQPYYKRLQHRCFPVNTEKFLRTPILKNNFEQLLLQSGSLLQNTTK